MTQYAGERAEEDRPRTCRECQHEVTDDALCACDGEPYWAAVSGAGSDAALDQAGDRAMTTTAETGELPEQVTRQLRAMPHDELAERAGALISAAREVAGNWSSGDLAGAVSRLCDTAAETVTAAQGRQGQPAGVAPSELGRMFEVAWRDEHDILRRLARRAGLLWQCSATGDGAEPAGLSCGQDNDEDAARCTSCGAPREAEHAKQPAPCWNAFCILTDCDGTSHTDTTGHSWAQDRGTVYCPACQSYAHGGPLAAGGCPNRYPAPVFTDYERGECTCINGSAGCPVHDPI